MQLRNLFSVVLVLGPWTKCYSQSSGKRQAKVPAAIFFHFCIPSLLYMPSLGTKLNATNMHRSSTRALSLSFSLCHSFSLLLCLSHSLSLTLSLSISLSLYLSFSLNLSLSFSHTHSQTHTLIHICHPSHSNTVLIQPGISPEGVGLIQRQSVVLIWEVGQYGLQGPSLL